MKKILSLILVLSMLLMLFSCTGNQVAQNETTKVETSNVETTQNADTKNNENVIKIGSLARATVDEKEMGNISKPFSESFEYHFYDDLTSGILALDRGDIDYFATVELIANYITNQNPGKYGVYDPKRRACKEFSMAALEKNKDIIENIDNAIKEMKAEGSLWDVYFKNVEITDKSNKNELPRFENAPTYKVVLTGDLPPFDYVDVNGNAAGFNVDLLTAISNKLKINFEIVTSNTASRFLMLESGKADIVFWAVRLSDFRDDVPEAEENILIANVDNSNLIEIINDVPNGVVITSPYIISKTARLYLKGSKYGDKVAVKKNVVNYSGTPIKLGEYTYNLPDMFKEAELTENDKKRERTAIYKYADKAKLVFFENENKEKVALRIFAENRKKSKGGCLEDKSSYYGCESYLLSFIKEEDGENMLAREHYFNDNGKIVGYTRYDKLKEIKLGNSNYYAYIPVSYGECKNDNIYEYIDESIYDTPKEEIFPIISIIVIDESKRSYDNAKSYALNQNIVDGITEEEFNNFAKDGWTLEEDGKYTELNHKGKIIDKLKGTSNGIDWLIYETIELKEGVNEDMVTILTKDEKNIVCIELRQPQEYWRAMGEAIAQTIHKK